MLASSESFAFDVQTYAGQQSILNNTLFSSENGIGQEYGGRIHVFPGNQDFFAMGFDYSRNDYKLRSNTELDGISVSSTGTFYGESYGPHLTITAPIPVVSIYLGFGYNFAKYTYTMDKISTQESANGESIESQLKSLVFLNSTGLRSAIGIKSIGRYNFMIEISDSFQTLEISRVRAAAANKVGGEYQPRDGNEDPFEASFQSLIGEKFNFSTRSIVAGFEFSL